MQNKRGLRSLIWPKRRYQNQESLLEKEQTARLIEIGIYLQQSRLEQSISLEEVALHTKIQPRLLRAIEEGRMDRLPEPVFIQGYIKLFAQSLNLDGASLAKTFPVDQSTQQPAKGLYLWLKLPFLQLRPMHLYLLYAVLIMGAVNSLSYLLDRPLAPSVTVPDAERGAIDPTNSNSTDIPFSQSRLSSGASTKTLNLAATNSLGATEQWAERLAFLGRNSQANESVQVNITLKEQSWLRVMADDKVAFEGILSEGTQQTWTAQKQLTLRAGNAGGVLVAHNGKPEQPLGMPGEVEEVTFRGNTQSSQQQSTQASVRSNSGL